VAVGDAIEVQAKERTEIINHGSQKFALRQASGKYQVGSLQSARDQYFFAAG
jgi:hypothetical protein